MHLLADLKRGRDFTTRCNFLVYIGMRKRVRFEEISRYISRRKVLVFYLDGEVMVFFVRATRVSSFFDLILSLRRKAFSQSFSSLGEVR